MKVSNKALAITGAVTLVLGYVIGWTTVFKAYFYPGNADASPAATASWCGSQVGRAAQVVFASTSNVCGNATSWNDFGGVLVFLGLALAVFAGVRVLLARRRASQVKAQPVTFNQRPQQPQGFNPQGRYPY